MIKISDLLTKLLEYAQFRVDTTRFFVDKPSFDYQPLPWVGIKAANIRGKATVGRWKVIKRNLVKSDKTLKDIGSCVGYFCISATIELGLYTLGVDLNDRFLRISRYATPLSAKNKCNFIKLAIDKKTVSMLPKTDITLCLSIWHHWVSNYGLRDSTRILQKLWSSTNRILFFESGEEEVKQEFNLPFPNNQKAGDWLFKYLSTNLKNARVEKIAKFPAGYYSHYLLKNKKRNLFKITYIK